MKKIAGVLLFLLLIAPGIASACYCNLNSACRREANDVKRLENKINNLTRRVAVLQARVDRLNEDKDEDLAEWDEKCEVLECNYDQARTDGDAVLRNYLNANPECNTVCSGYIRLQRVVDRKICIAQKAFDRCLQSRGKCADRYDRRIDHIEDEIAEYNAEIAAYGRDLAAARLLWQACYDAAYASCGTCTIITLQ